MDQLEAVLSEAEAAEFSGHGPLASLMEDDSVTEILVNGPDEIWSERAGKLSLEAGAFSSEDALRRYVRRLLAPHGRKVDQRSPFADSVIERGIRVHVAAPPVARKGFCLSLRKPGREPWSLSRLQERGSIAATTAATLREWVECRKNIFVCGGTGSGKTAMLTALLSEVNSSERLIALEDVAELRPPHPHFLSLEARPPNQEGEGLIPLQRLLREALRMRPDRIVVGECRGPEALDLLMALNTGHRGSMGTIHSNSPRDALQRLETLALLGAENLREGAVKALIASSIQGIVHLERAGGGRRVSALAEVKGVENGVFLLKETRFS